MQNRTITTITGVIFNYLGILAYRLKPLIENPRRDRCFHECDLEPREQVKRPRGELKISCFQKYSKKSSLEEKHHRAKHNRTDTKNQLKHS